MQSSLLTLASVPDAAPSSFPGGSVGDAAIRMGVALAALIAILGLVTYVLPRIVAKARGLRSAGSTDSASLSIVASLRVGPQASLLLVRCRERQMLVGVTPTGVSLVAPCDDVSFAREPATPTLDGRTNAPSPDFLTLLGRARGQKAESLS